MCGIWALIELHKKNKTSLYYDNFIQLKHRGPDMSSFNSFGCNNNVHIGFHRLAILDQHYHANQPYILEDGNRTIVFVCNGEIYNYDELIKNHELDIKTASDCLTIPKLYIKYTKQDILDDGYHKGLATFLKLFYREIKGEFAFNLFEFDKYNKLTNLVIGRDQIGVRPLYWTPFKQDIKIIATSSEAKGLREDIVEHIDEFEPGNIVFIGFDDFGNPSLNTTFDFKTVYQVSDKLEVDILTLVKQSVINSVKRRLNADAPIAFLLSGGVDSSLVCGISSKILSKPIRTFCCGMEGSTDLIAARKVAEHIGSIHTEVIFTPQEGLSYIRDVIRTIESWDTTTVRASVGQYIACKNIGEKTDCKVVMVGEGPDEVCSSYLFNYYAPNGKDLDSASKEYVNETHRYDVKRADRCISRWGLEGRVAFLDPEFIETYWKIDSEKRHPKYKNMEKWWLRKAFENDNIIPNEILWRKKEAFSDGVSSKEKSWFQYIQDYINEIVSDEEFKINPLGPSKEAHYYKKVFIELFGESRSGLIKHYWQPKWDASGNVVKDYIDPSARTLKVYN